jgi:hypothetical protein
MSKTPATVRAAKRAFDAACREEAAADRQMQFGSVQGVSREDAARWVAEWRLARAATSAARFALEAAEARAVSFANGGVH